MILVCYMFHILKLSIVNVYSFGSKTKRCCKCGNNLTYDLTFCAVY